MTSTFTWLDYSEHDRRKALDVIGLFNERETRDELGIGSVRDGFADLFFPGTTTIQTRARYFLFTPWIYTSLEARRTPSASFAERARQEEIRLIGALSASDDPDGTIGVQAQAHLQRLPSTIYWLGLGSWGIRTYPGSQDQYYRSADWFYLSATRTMRDDDGEPVDRRMGRRWHQGLPPVPPEFPKRASMRLAKLEAEYLRERIMSAAPRSLLAFLVDRGKPASGSEFPWEHPQFGEFPAWVREQLDHARNFSEVIHGSALLYNLMIAELAGKHELSTAYREKLRGWWLMLEGRRGALAAWSRGRLWEIVGSSGARVSHQARLFIDRWLDLALSGDGIERLVEDEGTRRLIRERERTLKGALSRLDERNQRARELWSGAAGTARLSYRWPVASRIVQDILAGLARDEPHA